jgi:WD40 repeat protein
VERWDPKQNRTVWKVDFLGSGRALEVSPDGNWVAHVSSFAVNLFDVETGKKVFRARENGYTAARFSPDSKTLALSNRWGVVSLWDTATGKRLPQSPDLPEGVSALIFSPDGRSLAASVGERWASWDLTPAHPEPQPTSLAEFTVLAPSGQAAARPDTFQRADLPAEFVVPVTGKLISRFNPPETGDTVVISRADHHRGIFSGDGKRFLGFRRSKRGPGGQQTELGMAVWDVATGKRMATWPDSKATSILSVSPDGKTAALLMPGQSSRLALWKADTNTTLWSRDLNLSVPVVTFTKGGDWLILQETYPFVPLAPFRIPAPPGPYPLLVLDAATGKERQKVTGPAIGEQPQLFVDDGYDMVPSAWAIAPDGRTAAFSGFDGTIHLWDVASDRERSKLTHPGPVHELAFSLDGKTLAAASLAAPVVLYDLSGSRPRP